MLGLPASAQPTPVAAQEAGAAPIDVHAAAREAYASGVAAFQREEYTAAAELFARADSLVSSPSAKLMLGRCLRQLGRSAEAYRVLDDSVREAERAGSERYGKVGAAAQQEIAELKRELAWLWVEVSGGLGTATLTVQGREVEPAELTHALAVAPGQVQVTLRAADGRELRRDLKLEAMTSTTLSLLLPAPPAPAPAAVATSASSAQAAKAEPSDRGSSAAKPGTTDPLRNVGYAVGVVGIATLIGSGVLGVLSAADFAELERECPNPEQCDPSYAHIASRGEAYQTAANVTLVVGAAALAAGITLFLVGGPGDRPSVALNAQGVHVRSGF